MIAADKFVEMIVAGINRSSMTEARVEHDVKIAGRQFDVIATIETALLKVLIGYEVKDKKRRVPAEQIEAFVTKANDAGISKKVYVSTSGYQSGALEVAKRHHVDLFEITWLDAKLELRPGATYSISTPRGMPDEPIYFEDKGFEIRPVITTINLEYVDGRLASVPDDSSQMPYYTERTHIRGKGSLANLLQERARFHVEEGKIKKQRIPLMCVIEPPDEYFFPIGLVSAVEIEILGTRVRIIGGNARMEPSAFGQPVIYKNVLTGAEIQTDIANLPLGGGCFEVGKFYFTEFPLMYYYCDKIKDDKVRLHLVESFQMQHLVRNTVVIRTNQSSFYIPVVDKVVLERLRKRLADYLNLARSDPTTG